jgi:hypothetical protein
LFMSKYLSKVELAFLLWEGLRTTLGIMYQHIKVPEGGQKITVNADYSLNVPDQPIIPYIEGDGTGFDITPVMIKVVDAAVAEGLRRQAQDPLDGDLRRREVDQGLRPDVWLPEETLASAARLRGVHQGPADDPGGWRHPLAQRRAAPGTRPLRLPAPGAVLRGRAQPGEGAAQGRHGDLPRELGGHLRRHRMGGRPTRPRS